MTETDDTREKLPRPAPDAPAAQLWEYIDHKEQREKGFWHAFEHLQQINRDLAKLIEAAQERERDHRRKVIELAAAYALPVCIRHVNDTVIGTRAATDAAFGLWDVLDNRFKAEQKKRQGDNVNDSNRP